jgi:hypothetical protein
MSFCSVKAAVHTSEGSEYVGEVNVLPPRTRSLRLAIDVEPLRLVAPGQLRVKLVGGAVPQAFAEIQVAVRPAGSGADFVKLPTLPPSPGADTVIAAVKKAGLEGLSFYSPSMELQAALLVTLSPGAAPERFEAKWPIVYYETSELASVRPSPGELKTLPAEIVLTFPELVGKAFPGLNRGLVAASFTIADHPEITLTTEQQWRDNKLQITVRPTDDTRDKFKTAHSVDLILKIELQAGDPDLQLTTSVVKIVKSG